MTRKRKPEQYARHTYPEMRQNANGVWYIYWTNTKRDSLKIKDKNIAIQVFNARKLQWQQEELQALEQNTEKKQCPTLSAFITEYRKYRENDGCASATVDNDELALNSLKAFVGGDKLLPEITKKDIDLFHADLQAPRLIETKNGRVRRFAGCRRAAGKFGESLSLNPLSQQKNVCFLKHLILYEELPIRRSDLHKETRHLRHLL